MRQTRLLWDMPITIELLDAGGTQRDIADVYRFFEYVDDTFSPFKKDSEISRMNDGLVPEENYSSDMREVLSLCEETKRETDGFFDVRRDGVCDPSGLVKGWAVHKASDMLKTRELRNFFIDAGGDIEVFGKNREGTPWRVGIRNPFRREENVKVVALDNGAVATSGTYVRGSHIYDPRHGQSIFDYVSFTVIGPNVYEADRFATAAFAMGRDGMRFIASKKGLEGYAIDASGIATFTPGFTDYVVNV